MLKLIAIISVPRGEDGGHGEDNIVHIINGLQGIRHANVVYSL